MDTSKTVSFFVIIIAVFGLFLNSQGKLLPILESFVTPSDIPSAGGVGRFVLAFGVYLFAMSFLNSKQGLWLTVILVMGALIVNSQQEQDRAIFPVLFGTQTV